MSDVARQIEGQATAEWRARVNASPHDTYAGPGSYLWHERVAELWDELPERVRQDAIREALVGFAAAMFQPFLTATP